MFFSEELFYPSALIKTSRGRESATEPVTTIAGVIADILSGCDGNAVIGLAFNILSISVLESASRIHPKWPRQRSNA